MTRLLVGCLSTLFVFTAVTDEAPLFSVCFAPGTSDEYVAEVTKKAAEMQLETSLAQSLARFRADDKWTSTATDGSVPATGDPLTLTWSIIPDGTSIPGFNGEPTANSDLETFLTGIYGNEATWLALFDQIFARWSELSGVTYVYESNDDGASFGSASGSLNVRGDLRIGGHFIDGEGGPQGSSLSKRRMECSSTTVSPSIRAAR